MFSFSTQPFNSNAVILSQKLEHGYFNNRSLNPVFSTKKKSLNPYKVIIIIIIITFWKQTPIYKERESDFNTKTNHKFYLKIMITFKGGWQVILHPMVVVSHCLKECIVYSITCFTFP